MRIADLPTSDHWTDYDWGSVLAEGREGEDVEWYSGPYIDATTTEIISQVPKGLVTPSRIVAIPHFWAVSNEGGGDRDVVLIAELRDGWASLTAWCDYTGWDCQSGGNWKWAATKDEIIKNGLDKEGRIRLGLALPGEVAS